MKIRGYITCKKAEYYTDCADYFKVNTKTKRIAVSDGVSQSIMPAEWAQILVDSYVDGDWEPQKEIKQLQEKWFNKAQYFLNSQKEEGINNWILEDSLNTKDGAGATFCGISFKKNKWEASILGDTCLVIIEDNHIVEIIGSKDGIINYCPDYFDSFKERRGEVKERTGELKKNNVLLLVSDPFSELFQKIKNTEKEHSILEDILSLKSSNDYEKFVVKMRDNYQMHNDDSTLVIVEYDGSKDFTISYQSTLEDLIKEDDKDWKNTERKNSIDEYKRYIESHPRGNHIDDANKNIEALETKEGSQQPQTNATKEAKPKTSSEIKKAALSIFDTFYEELIEAFKWPVIINKKKKKKRKDRVHNIFMHFINKLVELIDNNNG